MVAPKARSIDSRPIRVICDSAKDLHFLVVLWVEIRSLMLLWGNVLFAFLCTQEEFKEVQMTTIINCWPVGSVPLKSA